MRGATGKVWIFVLATLAIAAGPASSQQYPNAPVRIVSGLQTGSSGDTVGRMIAQKLTERLAQPFTFEGRPGAGGFAAAGGLAPCRKTRGVREAMIRASGRCRAG